MAYDMFSLQNVSFFCRFCLDSKMTGKGYKITTLEDDENCIYHPLSTANIFSVLTFWWMNSDVLRTGNERPLEQSDFLPLHPNDRTRDMTERLKNQWNSGVERCNREGTKPKLWKSILKLISLREICITCSVISLESIGRNMEPLLVGILIQFMRTANEDASILYFCLQWFIIHPGSFR